MKSILFFSALTLLTACNVNSQSKAETEVKVALEKLEYLTGSLELSTETIRNNNKQLLSRIEREVNNKGNRPFDLTLVKNGKETVMLTDQLFDKLITFQNDLKKLSTIEEQNNYMIDEKNAEKLKSAIDDYILN